MATALAEQQPTVPEEEMVNSFYRALDAGNLTFERVLEWQAAYIRYYHHPIPSRNIPSSSTRVTSSVGNSPALPTLGTGYVQPPLPGVGGPAGILSPGFRRTPARYYDLPHYSIAEGLVEGSSVHLDLRPGCTLVLTLILAWLQFPLFKRRGWLLFGTDRMRRELSLRNDRLLSYIKELQRAGLLQAQAACFGGLEPSEMQSLKLDCARLDPDQGGNFWQPRCIQSRATVYRLGKDVRIPVSTLEFNPWEGRGKGREGRAEVGRVVGKDLEATRKDVMAIGKSFPRPQLIPDSVVVVVDNAPENFEKKRADKLESQIEELNPSENEVFGLWSEAEFEGYPEKGASRQKAYDLAVTVGLEESKEAIDQASEMWGRGEVKKSPIGLAIAIAQKGFSAAGLNEAATRLQAQRRTSQKEEEIGSNNRGNYRGNVGGSGNRASGKVKNKFSALQGGRTREQHAEY